MITKAKLAERLQRLLQGGSTKPELKITLQDCMLAVAQSRDKLITAIVAQNKQDGNHTFPYDIISEVETVVEGKKAPLPKRGLSILKHNSGIYRVTTTNCEEPIELIPRKRGADTLYRGQEIQGLGGMPSYIPALGHLKVSGVSDGCELLVEMVVAGEDFGMDEPFAIPPDLQDDVITTALGIMQVMYGIPEDKVTDAKENG
jgi:hypothetical protein